ncbi:MAG TPA: tetratricopeptide repeat protein [Terriglobales bacterium]|nr:tetratricopeptide repeat protein [Terriglobales bacterium]
MRAETRHQLKQDRFSRATFGAAEATAHWTAEHQTKLIIGGIVLAVVLATVGGGWYYLNREDQRASVDLNQAVRTLDTPLRPVGAPAEPDSPSFTSVKERATEAHKQFQTVVDKYPRTRTAEFARYFVGLTSAQMGDNAAAERALKDVASSHNDDLAALAKLALAGVYRDTNRTKEAIDLYNGLVAKPTRSVGKVTAQVELADTYESSHQPAEAKRIYEQIQRENPASEVAQFATQKLQALK